MSTAVEQPILTAEQQLQAERSQGIGGSDTGDIFNVGYGCERMLAFEKTGIAPDFSHTPAQLKLFRRGKRLEEVVADEYVETTGRKIRRVGMRTSRLYPWMLVHIDRQILNDKRGPGALECKTASPWVYSDMAENGLPEQYSLQLQHSLIVSGYKWGAFAVMDMAKFEILTFERELNKELAAVIVAKESEFWNRYVLPSRDVLEQNQDATMQSLLPILQPTLPPQLDNPRDRRCASCLWRKTCRGQAVIVPDPSSNSYVADDGLAELAGDYIDALNICERYGSMAADIEERLKQSMGDRQRVAVPAVMKRMRYAWQKGRSTWDTKALEGAIGQFSQVLKLLKAHGGDPMTPEHTAQLETTLEVIGNQLANSRKRGNPVRAFYFEDFDGTY